MVDLMQRDRELRAGRSQEPQEPTYREPVAPDPNTTVEELVNTFKSTIRRCWILRERYAAMWVNCVAFLRGDQWADWDADYRDSSARRELLPPAVEDAKTVDNQLPIYYNKHQVYFRQAMPKLKVDPPSMRTEADKLAAELATRVLDVRRDPDSGNEMALFMRAVRLQLLFGEVLARVQWDPDALDGKGDVLMELVDVFGFLKDPYSVGMWPPRFLIEMDCRHLEEIHDIYGVWVQRDVGLVERTQYYDMLAINVGQSTWQQARTPMEDAAMVYRIGFPASRKYPKGMCFHLVGDQIVRRHEWQGGIWPYVRAVWEESELNLYGVGLIERLLTDQIQRNMLRSIGFESAIVKARGDLWVSGPEHTPRQEVYNKRTGATITHLSPQSQVKPRETGMNFQDARFELELGDDNMHRKSNLPRPALGQPLEKERTLGAQVMSHQIAGTDAGEKVEEFGEQFLIPIATRELRLYGEYATTPREIDMGVSGGIFSWYNRHLRGAVKVHATAPPHMSPAMRRSMLATARQEGLLPPYPTARSEVSARQVLLQLGLEGAERMAGEPSVPLENVIEEAKLERALAYKLVAMQAMSAIMQLEAAMNQANAMRQQLMGGGGGPEQEALAAEAEEEEDGLPVALRPRESPGVGEPEAVQQRPGAMRAGVG